MALKNEQLPESLLLESLRESAADLQEALSLLIRQLRHACSMDGMTLSQVNVLQRLGREGSRTCTDLARLEKVTRQSMSVTVKGLIRAGLAERRRSSCDRRQYFIALTDRGMRYFDERDRSDRGHLTQLIAERLDAHEQKAVTRTAALLVRLAEATPPGRSPEHSARGSETRRTGDEDR
ncbi:MarR family winged helix-turn-helix transcriptional regulator [Streptomyces sp. NPDC001262]|uniref:MarR family winged helix-turn-helix transcriptional regulator n=1 Tax=Streptomyces sp. NPDC001262 TaxID=3364552 RepID=UPI0036B9D4A8